VAQEKHHQDDQRGKRILLLAADDRLRLGVVWRPCGPPIDVPRKRKRKFARKKGTHYEGRGNGLGSGTAEEDPLPTLEATIRTTNSAGTEEHFRGKKGRGRISGFLRKLQRRRPEN